MQKFYHYYDGTAGDCAAGVVASGADAAGADVGSGAAEVVVVGTVGVGDTVTIGAAV